MIERTPEVLQAKYQMPVGVGRPRALANIFFAYEGRRQTAQGWGICDLDDGSIRRVMVSQRGANRAAAKLNDASGRDRYRVVESDPESADPLQAQPGRAVAYVKANPKKFRFLVSAITLTVTKALPEDGEEWKHCEQVSQADLAAVAGLKRRETVTRRISQYTPRAAAIDRYWHIVDRTRGKIVRRRITKERAESWCTVANLEAGSERYYAEPRDCRQLEPEILFQRNRQFTSPNFYSYAGIPSAKVRWAVETESGVHVKSFRRKDKAEALRDLRNKKEQGPRLRVVMQELEATCFHAPTLTQLHDDPRFAEFFGAKGYHGFTLIPGWLWHEKSKLSEKARLVMTYYIFCGLFRKNGLGRPIGEVHPLQSTVARACGLSTKSIYLANRELSDAGLIRVYHPKPRKLPNGSYTNGPASILYLPIRMLSLEEAEDERKRFRERLGRITGVAARARVQTLHDELLDSWTSKEHCLMAFWREMERRLRAEGITQSVISALLPLPPS
jgi:hypothetical protein